jgi:hypothetical protein
MYKLNLRWHSAAPPRHRRMLLERSSLYIARSFGCNFASERQAGNGHVETVLLYSAETVDFRLKF